VAAHHPQQRGAAFAQSRDDVGQCADTLWSVNDGWRFEAAFGLLLIGICRIDLHDQFPGRRHNLLGRGGLEVFLSGYPLCL